MENRKEILLEYIIKEYIKNPEPIGSEHLKLQLNIKISSATIRNYFKKMVEEGELSQLHISCGRVPTKMALQRYWQKKLLPLRDLNADSLDDLKRSAKETGLFCVVKFFKPNRLKEIINASSRYLVLVFENGESVIGYTPVMERFCNELKEMDVDDILKVAKQVKADELANKLEEFLKSAPLEREGSKELISMVGDSGASEAIIIEAMEGSIIDRVDEGLYFEELVPNGYMGVKQGIKINSEDAKMFFLGSLVSDIEQFYRRINE